MNITKWKQTDRYREETSGYQRGEVSGRDKIGEWDKRYKLLGIK